MEKFIALNASHLRLDNLAGLTAETVAIASQQSGSVLGPLGTATLQTLGNVNTAFLKRLHRKRASELTPQIREKGRLRNVLFAEIKRTSKTGRQSSLPAVADAGARMTAFLEPFRKTDKEPVMSQTAQITIISSRYAADATLAQAAATLGIAAQIQALFTASSELENLYNRRLDEMAAVEGPAASALKSETVKAYNRFCATIEITLSVQPSAALQLLFNEMNGLRRKYVADRPSPLDEAHTFVAAIAGQPHTGRPVTPLPRVFYRTGNERRELVFSRDYAATYRNNVRAGEARLLLHGKGKYTGRYETTFHILPDP
ncbi:MAG: DUF6261 family protein [Tannerella sp.]|nr:DUF6261 family protein [Tannerella sp.]